MSNLTNRAASRASGPPKAQREATVDDAKRAVPNEDGSPNILRFGDGLMLWVTPRQKMWRTKVYRAGKSSTQNLGQFPAVSIKEAKAKSAALKIAPNPAQAKRAEKAQAIASETTVREIAPRAIAARALKRHWTDEVLAAVNRRVAKYILPKLGDRAIAAVTMDEVEAVVSAVHQKHPATAVFVKQYLSLICAYAVRWKMIAFNPVKQIAEDLPSRSRGDETSRPYVGTIEDARVVLAAVEARASVISPWTLLALRLVALTAVRSSEALGARWSEIDFDKAVWTIPAERMKGKHGQRREHIVALAPQAIEALKVARALRTNGNEFVFPSHHGKKRSMDRSTLSTALRKALVKAELPGLLVPHGWRHSFMTISNEVDDGASFRVVDVMLAHSAFRDHAEERDARKGGAERHYNHARYLPARHRIACQWADMLLPPGSPTAHEVLYRVEVPNCGSKAGNDAYRSLRTVETPTPATNVVPLRRSAA